MSLPELDTVYFDGRLPLCFHRDAPGNSGPSALLETRLALAVLAAPGTQDNDSNPLLQRLEAKLDLVLALGILSRHPQSLALRDCRIGLEALIWHDTQALQPGQQGLLQLQTGSPSACMLFLPIEISHSHGENSHFCHHGKLLPLGAEVDTQRWESWVFRQHRQQIGQKKS